MNGSAADVQQLARMILGMLDPLVQAGTALSAAAENGAPGKCQQVWCPVCAVAAIAAGEQHPLASVVAEHGAALLAVIRSVADAGDPDPADDAEKARADEPTQAPSRYQPIPVTLHE
jgi:hypothetical protein